MQKNIRIKGAEATCVKSATEIKKKKEKSFRLKDMLDFNIIWLFSAHMNIFQQHYLENRKLIFLVCIPKQVYAPILESLKYKDLLHNCQTNFHEIFDIFISMISVEL